MTFLPIVGRELRVASRRRTTYITRCVGAGVVVLVGGWLYTMMWMDSPANVARSLFNVLGGFAVLSAALSGAQYTADCISSEKREDTLGLLFLTDLKGFDVVLGKLVATSLNAFYGLLATLPVLAIPLLIGGVSPGEFWRMSLLAIDTMLMSLAIGLLASSYGRSARQCSGMALLGICILSLFLPFLGWWATNERGIPGAQQYLSLTSPAIAFSQVKDSIYRSAPHVYWRSMATMHGLTWAFLFLASVIVPRTWQHRPAVATHPLRQKWLEWKYGRGASRLEYRRRLLDINPFFWITSRVRMKPTMVWLLLLLIGAGWLIGYLKFPHEWLNQGTYVVTALLLTSVIKIWVAGEVTHRLAEDKQSGALELLLTTPLDEPQIFEGQRLSLRRQFAGAVIVVLLAELVLTVAATRAEPSVTAQTGWISLGLASMVMFVADLAALYWVGMWAGLRAPNAQKAASWATGAILVLPWVVFAIVLMLLAMGSMLWRGSGPGWSFLLGLWLVIGIAVDVLLSAGCKEQLRLRFRQLVAFRFRTTPR